MEHNCEFHRLKIIEKRFSEMFSHCEHPLLLHLLSHSGVVTFEARQRCTKQVWAQKRRFDGKHSPPGRSSFLVLKRDSMMKVSSEGNQGPPVLRHFYFSSEAAVAHDERGIKAFVVDQIRFQF